VTERDQRIATATLLELGPVGSSCRRRRRQRSSALSRWSVPTGRAPVASSGSDAMAVFYREPSPPRCLTRPRRASAHWLPFKQRQLIPTLGWEFARAALSPSWSSPPLHSSRSLATTRRSATPRRDRQALHRHPDRSGEDEGQRADLRNARSAAVRRDIVPRALCYRLAARLSGKVEQMGLEPNGGRQAVLAPRSCGCIPTNSTAERPSAWWCPTGHRCTGGLSGFPDSLRHEEQRAPAPVDDSSQADSVTSAWSAAWAALVRVTTRVGVVGPIGKHGITPAPCAGGPRPVAA
jgi:hypothetical protein